jgi:hypothetical protein
MKTAFGPVKAARIFGGNFEPAPPPKPAPIQLGISLTVVSLTGKVLLSIDDLALTNGNLHWPSPLSAPAYAIKDFPRFYAPEWGPAVPIPADVNVEPALIATNGYDYRNNQDGDTYVFLLGSDLPSWHSARSEFTTLTGPTPVLPDYAWGTWFTW